MSFGRRARRGGVRVAAYFSSLPIRMRLALVSTAMTFTILCAFAAIVGDVTVHRIRSDFYRQVSANANDLATAWAGAVHLQQTGNGLAMLPDAQDILTHQGEIRWLTLSGTPLPGDGHRLGAIYDRSGNLVSGENSGGLHVENRIIDVALPGGSTGKFVMQYGRPLSQMDSTIDRVRWLLLLGVVCGTGLAMLGGLMIARRAMSPIARLTSTAREIARTRDPRRRVEEPDAEDEVAELARTFDEMLRGLDAARRDTEATLARQRQFVADASHELRTPLTSVLANLELLAESLRGEEGDAARSALRSTKRMRRLVGDLLLLARSDVSHETPRAATDLSELVMEAAAELEPISGEHVIEVDASRPVVIEGVRDDLLRLVLNLIENAVRHTPPGTTVWVRVGRADTGGDALVTVEDDGPGVPEDIAPTLFDRFVRGEHDRGGSAGLGLSIVRAVAETHDGTVELQERPGGAPGARFVVRLPLSIVVHGGEVPAASNGSASRPQQHLTAGTATASAPVAGTRPQTG